jgi:hypothetical protein
MGDATISVTSKGVPRLVNVVVDECRQQNDTLVTQSDTLVTQRDTLVTQRHVESQACRLLHLNYSESD